MMTKINTKLYIESIVKFIERKYIVLSLSLFLSLWVSSTFAGAPDLYNPDKLYYSVSTKEERSGNCSTRVENVRYFANGKDAYWSKPPAGFKKYTAWCWKKGRSSCDDEVVAHGLRPWCQNGGCRRGVFNNRSVICDKKR